MQSTQKRFAVAQTVFKVLPFVTATIFVVSTVLASFGIYSIVVDALFGSSVMTLSLMYYMNYLFQLCKYHRLMIHYQVSVNMVYLLDGIFGSQLSADVYVEIVVALYGAFAIAYALLMLFGRKRNQ